MKRTFAVLAMALALDVAGGLTVPTRTGARVVPSFAYTTTAGASGTSAREITLAFVAETIDRRSGERRSRTFDVVDCGAQPRLLVGRIEFYHAADNTPAPRRPPRQSPQ